jgi:secreted trypsin-like serine protease
MRRSLGIVVALVALALGGVAQALTGGALDTSHTYVGAYLQQQVHNGQVGTELCTGWLIGPTSFVTATHCFDQTGGPVVVSFDPDLSAATHFTTATLLPNHTLGDIAVFTLTDAQPGPYATLPSGPTATSAVDIVGYGVEGLTPQKTPTGFGVRQIVTTPVKSAGSQADQFLKLLSGPGACFGDSGGPNFASGTSTVVAITSGGSKNCNGVSYATRIDTPDVLPFLTHFANT